MKLVQKTTELFDEEGIHLNSLSEILFDEKNQPIANARENLERALSDYTLEVERIQNQPVEMNPIPSPSVLETFVHDNEFYPFLTDKSDTADILDMPELTPEELSIKIQYTGAIEMNGMEYDKDYITKLTDMGVNLTDNELLIQTELDNLQKAIDNVITQVKSLNSATRTRFDRLKDFKLIFNQPIDPSTFTDKQHATLSIQAADNLEDNTSTESVSTEAGDTSTESVSTEAETPAEDTSTEEIPTEDIPVETETSAEDMTPTETETPAEEVPVE